MQQANHELTPTREAVADEEAIYRKVTWRLLPFLMICYRLAGRCHQEY